jgi:hypothetical protein
MSTWGLTLSIFDELAEHFPQFLTENFANALKAEYFLPDVVGKLVHENKARVIVLPGVEKWFGMTYREVPLYAQQAIRAQVQQGVYPNHLWSDEKVQIGGS